MKKLSIQMRERCGSKFLKTTLQAEPEQQAVLLTGPTGLHTTLDSRQNQSVNFFFFFHFKTDVPVACISIVWKLSMHHQHAYDYCCWNRKKKRYF